MRQTNQSVSKLRAVSFKGIAVAVFVLMMILPITIYANDAAWQNQSLSNQNWQNTHNSSNWNYTHNWAYHAPQYHFETTFPANQWGRPTTSNATPQLPQNVRTDRHAAYLPPTHGSVSGFYSGEFATSRVNPFAPTFNNNPNASHAIAVNQSPFAVLPREPGTNVIADNSQPGTFMPNTSVVLGSGSNVTNNPPPADLFGFLQYSANNQVSLPNESHSGFTVTHTPHPLNDTPQTGYWHNRITTVTPFEDGTIGRLFIPALNNRSAAIRPGVAMPTLDNYIGHFPGTSQWDGNVALASHNRGPGSFFAGIWTLRNGDRIYYQTTLGTRVYEVVSVQQIPETDLSNLNHSHENILNLITCVYWQPTLRWNIRAREVS